MFYYWNDVLDCCEGFFCIYCYDVWLFVEWCFFDGMVFVDDLCVVYEDVDVVYLVVCFGNESSDFLRFGYVCYGCV